jgi:serine/threonine-protein kinase HipA
MSTQTTVLFGPAAILMQQHPSDVATLGYLHFDQIRNAEISSFECSDIWLKAGNDWFLDPDISFFSGRQYPPYGKSVFGMISDSCPDRWGRTLLQRNEARVAALENRQPRHLNESDYLLGVNDASRIGALRFTSEENAVCLADGSAASVPPWVRLRSLEHAANSLEHEDTSHKQLSEDLALLLAPGSSLGGARPKASVQDARGGLWIAKFPSKTDTYDSGLAEYLTYELAEDFGLLVAEAAVDAFSNRGHTFLIKRFDRDGSLRVHFSSAMNLLGLQDGESSTAGVSYLDVLTLIREHGSSPEEDSLELFKRILFSIAVSNTDDHLRNHGFLLSAQGWRLSPLYDVNPNPNGRGLSLNISEFDNSLSFDLAVAQAAYFGLSENKAKTLVDELKKLVASWETRAIRLKMDAATRQTLRPAFIRCC